MGFKNPNFAKVAEAMGAKGIRIAEPADVREGLAEALASKDGPVVVDAVVDPMRSRSVPLSLPYAQFCPASSERQTGLGDYDH